MAYTIKLKPLKACYLVIELKIRQKLTNFQSSNLNPQLSIQ